MWGLFIGLICLGAVSLLGFVAGWGLLRMQDWARWLSIGLALLGLPLFPIGSVAGALIIAYLLQSPVSEAFLGNARGCAVSGSAAARRLREPATAKTLDLCKPPTWDKPDIAARLHLREGLRPVRSSSRNLTQQPTPHDNEETQNHSASADHLNCDWRNRNLRGKLIHIHRLAGERGNLAPNVIALI